MPLTIRPLTPDLWPQLEDMFGRKGACNGCWCMYWRIGGAYGRRPREDNKADFRAVVERGPPPGLLALEGELAVGWCQLTPRSALPHLGVARYLGALDETPVWSISCFYVRSKHRRRGVTAALIAEAARVAKAAGAPAREAYPVDKAAPKGASNAFTGIASTFERAGFTEVARRSPARPIMRLQLTPPP